MGRFERAPTPPPEWEGLISADDWRYLSEHFPEEDMRDLRTMIEAAPPDFGAKLVAEIREVHTVLPDPPPDLVLLLAVPRAA